MLLCVNDELACLSEIRNSDSEKDKDFLVPSVILSSALTEDRLVFITCCHHIKNRERSIRYHKNMPPIKA